jgi:transcription elongation factor GreA
VTDETQQPKTGARELMRSLGLMVDGPARWERPVISRVPGVFVVELPGGATDPPIDYAAVRRWVERVPGMTIEGERATAPALADRLRSFWLPGEPILYIGRSAKTLGGRLAAAYATPLGDARPSSAASWLRVLSVQADLRIWWAETEAHEEYEDALLTAVAERNDGRPPFANLVGAGGARRDDGIRGATLAEDTSPGPPKRGAKAAAKPRASAAKRATGDSPTRRTKVTDAPGKPSAAPTYLSAEGLEKLTAELEHLRTVTRPEVIARVAAARALGDLRENADYEYARKEQSFVEGRIQTLEQMLRHSVIIEAPAAGESAHLGSTVVVETDGVEATYLLVGPTEADPSAGKISNASPVGAALIGARAGDAVTVRLPSGAVSYKVREVR